MTKNKFKVVLSRTLSTKLKYLKGKMRIEGLVQPISVQSQMGMTQYVPASQYVAVIVYLEDHPEPEYDIEQCEKWRDIIRKYFSTSYSAFRVDVGPFKGLYPIEINSEHIEFQCTDFDQKPSWRDWFIMEGDKYAPELTIELLPNVCNS